MISALKSLASVAEIPLIELFKSKYIKSKTRNTMSGSCSHGPNIDIAIKYVSKMHAFADLNFNGQLFLVFY